MFSPINIISQVRVDSLRHSYLVAIALAAACLPSSVALAQSTGPSARIAQFADDRAAAISYTFDDNLRDQLTLAVPMLNEVGFKGTFFVIAGKTAETPQEGEQKAKETDVRKQWGGISWPELKEMSDQGHEIGSHTWSHRTMPKIPPAEADAELSKAYDAIRTHIGKPPLTLAFPYNQSTPELQADALKYHVAYRAFQTSTSGKSTVASMNGWADKLVQEKQWGIIMTHAVAHGYAQLSDPEILRAHFKYVKAHEHDIWVDTFADIARYQKERENTMLKSTAAAWGATCLLTSTLDPQLYDVPLTIVFDVPGVSSAHAKRGTLDLPAHVNQGRVLVAAAPDPQPIMITWN